MKKRLLLLGAFLALFATSTWAREPRENRFPTLDILNHCNFTFPANCSGPYSATDFGITPAGLIQHPRYLELLDQVSYLAVVWGDTIMEGDCWSTGATELSRIVEVKKGPEIVAYLLKYYEPALLTDGDDCTYYSERRRWEGVGCVEAIASEGSLVNANLKDHESFYSGEFAVSCLAK